MRAWRVHELGEPGDVLVLDDVDEPSAGPGQVVVQVEVVALNFADILYCRGEYQAKPPLPFTPGLEAAGVVVEAGEGVATPVGTRVIALATPPAGAMAERVVVEADAVLAIPDDMPASAAAALHITYGTGHVALHRRAGLQAGETLLVHAGAGGVGSAAIQLGLAAGATVIATAGGADKVDLLRRLGAHVAVDYRDQDFVEVVKEVTEGRGADVVYDPVGGDTFDRSRRCIAWEGRILIVGFAGGRIAEAPTNHLLVKNYSVVGVHFPAYRQRAPEVVAGIHADLVALYAAGRIDPVISQELPLAEAPAALGALASRGTWGRVVLKP
jgi:NADPH:quinone reductase